MTSDELNSKNAFYPETDPLDEEDEFLRELRQLAGMDEPAAPAQKPAVKEETYSQQASYQPPVPQYEAPVQQYQQPVQQYEQPVEQPQQPAWEPDYPTPAESLYEDRDSVLPGWLKGILLLTASAATLVLTVLAVLNGLQH